MIQKVIQIPILNDVPRDCWESGKKCAITKPKEYTANKTIALDLAKASLLLCSLAIEFQRYGEIN